MAISIFYHSIKASFIQDYAEKNQISGSLKRKINLIDLQNVHNFSMFLIPCSKLSLALNLR